MLLLLLLSNVFGGRSSLFFLSLKSNSTKGSNVRLAAWQAFEQRNVNLLVTRIQYPKCPLLFDLGHVLPIRYPT